MFVPVLDANNKPLMPTTAARARRWLESRKATPFWRRGVFCVRLNVEPSAREAQSVAVGVDPGSKKEGLTVKSKAHTYLNVQADAVTWVKDHVETRREMRRGRRFRKTPCRANRSNRSRLSARHGPPPSTKARWQWKLRLIKWLASMVPVTDVCVEDITAKTTGKKRWDSTFSPLQVGKAWFYSAVANIATLHTRFGWQTKCKRDELGLEKSSSKMAAIFAAHCVDSFVLAHEIVGGPAEPDNKTLLLATPLRFHRRQLHRLQPEKGGIRKPYGGTRSHGFKRGALVRHPKCGLAYIGGILRDRISLHDTTTGKRLCQNAKPGDIEFLAFNSWRAYAACMSSGLSRGTAASLSSPD